MGAIGVLGGRWRADVTAWGDIIPWDGSDPLEWYVAADDRWHVPRREQAVRQVRLGGTAVYETRVKVPGGDAVQRVYAVADNGGLTVVEVENDSSLPIAVAFSRADLLTSRPPAQVPIEGGLDLPPESSGVVSVVLPVGHRSRVTVALSHSGGAGLLPDDLPPVGAVVRGWQLAMDRASTLSLPDQQTAEAVLAARCETALGAIAHADDDAVGFVLGACEAVRLGQRADVLVPELGAEIERLGRAAAGREAIDWDLNRAIVSFGEVLTIAGDHRARTDLDDLRSRLGPCGPRPSRLPEGVRCIPWVEDLLVRPESDGSCTLFPDGLPDTWRGTNFEVYRVPGGGGHHVSLAVRWHGERPALLWEVAGPVGLALRGGGLDPSWSTIEAQGEALLHAAHV